MGKLEIGLYDILDGAAMAAFPVAADVYDQHLQMAQEAEQLGYKYYFSIEHQTSKLSYLSSPNIYLTALARATSTIRFGAMIYQLPFHHPLRLAQDTAMLDHLSRGRLEFGAGTGVAPHEFIRWNVPFEDRRAISEETLEIVRRAWTQGSVTFKGKFFDFKEAQTSPKPYQQPHPPIWFAAHSAASFEYAAKMNFNVSQNIDTDEVIAEKFANWRNLWKQAGHDGPMPKTFLARHVHVADTDEQARAEAEPHLVRPREADPEFVKTDVKETANIGVSLSSDGRYLREQDTPERLELQRIFRERGKSYDFWVDTGMAIVGSPDTVARKMQEQLDLIGHDIFCAQHWFGGMPADTVMKSIRLFGEKVLPAFE